MDRKVLLLMSLWTLLVGLVTLRSTEFYPQRACCSHAASSAGGTTVAGAEELSVLAMGYLSLKPPEYERAAQCFEKALVADPENFEAALWLGCCLRKLKKPGAAMTFYERAISIDRDEPRAIFMLGSCFAEELGDFSRARACLYRLQELEGREPEELAAKLEKIMDTLQPRRGKPGIRTDLARGSDFSTGTRFRA